MSTHAFKCLFIGDAGTGKTTFLKRHLTGEFEPRYINTPDVEVYSIYLNTPDEKLMLDAWDISGQAKSPSAAEKGYYMNGREVELRWFWLKGSDYAGHMHGRRLFADYALIFFDVTSRTTFKSVEGYIREMDERGIPYIVVGNKCDIREREVTPEEITSACNGRYQYFDISVKSRSNFEKLFLHLARRLTGNEMLEDVEV